jgi:hypothetical protein
MDNRITDVEARDLRLTPAAAEVRVVVRAERRTPATAVRGRLVGPRCAFANTVEVAYPLSPVPAETQARAEGELAARVVIPEASLWDPQSPFLYVGPVELWEGQRRCDAVTVRHGLRDVRVRHGGIAVNGRPLAVRGKEMPATCSDDEALRLRQAGYNLLVTPVSESTTPLWDVGDRLGFLVAGRVSAADADTLRLLGRLGRHASCAGWFAAGPAVAPPVVLPAGTLDQFGPFD